MLVLDENLPGSQWLLLRKWRIRFRVVGVEIAASGTLDPNLIPILHHLRRPVLFTLDGDFFRPDWCHARYGLVWLDVTDERAAEFIRRFLKHPLFDTQAKRMGVVARVHADGIEFWQIPRRSRRSVPWPAA
jgi:hypothetical protein